MGKTEYRTKRRRARDKNPSREERGLSHHPDGSGTHVCPDCEGAGETIHNDTNPHGFGSDPQCDEPVRCNTCMGSGEIADGVREVLSELHAARYRLRLRLKGARFSYESARRRAFMPVSGLAMAEMLAKATRCATETERGVAAMRVAA